MKKTPLLLAGVLGLSLCLPAGAASFAEKRINTALNKGTPLCWKFQEDNETLYLNVWVLQKSGPRFLWVGEMHETRKRPTDWRKIDYFGSGSGTLVGAKVMMQGHDGVYNLPTGMATASSAMLLSTKNLNGTMRVIDREMNGNSQDDDAEYSTTNLRRIKCN